MAGPAAPAIADMNAHLQQVIGVNNATMRVRIIDHGIGDLEALVSWTDDMIKNACNAIRKSQGAAATREVSMLVEHRLKQLEVHCRCKYLVQRTLDYDAAPRDELDAIWEWFTQLGDDPEESTVPSFKETQNKRVWFESVDTYLSCKKGAAGVPLLYVIRPHHALPADDPGFMQPSIEEELFRRGRHDGIYWDGDKRLGWVFLRLLTHGTIAYAEIKAFARATNGSRAYFTLKQGQVSWRRCYSDSAEESKADHSDSEV